MSREEALGLIVLVLVRLQPDDLEAIAAHARQLVEDQIPTPPKEPTA